MSTNLPTAAAIAANVDADDSTAIEQAAAVIREHLPALPGDRARALASVFALAVDQRVAEGDDRGTAERVVTAILGIKAAEWPEEPDLPGPPEPEPLPLDTLPPSIRAHVESVAGATQTPPDLAAVLALACISTAVGGRAVVEASTRRGWKEPTNIYAIAILPPGTRKSAVYAALTAPLTDWEREERDRLGPAYRRARDRVDVAAAALKDTKVAAAKMKSSREDLEAVRAELDAAEAAVPLLPQLNAPDATPEALVEVMAAQGGRLAILAPEGDPLRLADGRYSDGAPRLGELKQAHCGEPIRQNRKGREPTYVERPVLTLALTMQPGVLETLKNKGSFRGEGVLGRIMWVVPEHGLGRRLTGLDVPALDLAAADRYSRILVALLNSAHSSPNADPYLLSLDPAALGLLHAFEAEAEPQLRSGGRLAGITDWAGKMVGQAVRLAALLELAARADAGNRLWSDPISGWAMDGGVRLVRALASHALLVFSEVGHGSDSDLGYVMRRALQLPAGSTFRDLHRSVRGRASIKDADHLRKLLDELEERGCLRLVAVRQEGAGRPSGPVVDVHPKLRTGIAKIAKTSADQDFGNFVNPYPAGEGRSEHLPDSLFANAAAEAGL